MSLDCADRAMVSQSRRRRTQQDSVERRADRAEALVCMGELSAGRQALEGAPVAPGNDRTLRELRNPVRRPPQLRAPFSEDLLTAQPEIPFQLDQGLLVKNLKSARRGAAGGPSGMTAEHLRPLLDSAADCDKFWFLCQAFAQAHIPEEVLTAVRMGRITALQKPSGGIRGIVVGDMVRRLVSRTIAQQIGSAVEVATAPHQYAMSTRAGCECIAHMLQVRTDLDDRATVVSIDGIGAFDFVSRESMLRGLLRVKGGESVLPFVRQFHASPSNHIWHDEHGIVPSR